MYDLPRLVILLLPVICPNPFHLYVRQSVDAGPIEQCVDKWEHGPFVAFGRRVSETSAICLNAEVVTAIEVAIGSMPALAQ